MAEPWTMEDRNRVKRKIDKEAVRTAARLGAQHAVIIAFYKDGEYLHMQDGGSSPMPLRDLYGKLASAMDILKESDGADVAMQ